MRNGIVVWCLFLVSVNSGYGQLTKLWELDLPTYFSVQPSYNINSRPYLKFVEDNDGNRIVLGLYTAEGRSGIYLFKHDTNGQVVWEYTYPSPYEIGEEVSDICLDSNGDVIVVGSTVTEIMQDSNYTVPHRNWLILKISQSGELLRALEGSEQDSMYNSCNGVFPDDKGNLYTAHLIQIDSIFYTYIFKFNSNGDIIWRRQVDQNTPLVIYKINESIVLITEGSTSHLYQFTDKGDLVYTQDFGHLNYEKPVIDKEGNWYLRSTTGKYKVEKIDKFGTSKWIYHKQTNLPPNVLADELTDVFITNNGDVFATGRYYGLHYGDTSMYTNCDILTVKIDSSGIVQWEDIYRFDDRRSCQIGEKILVDSAGYTYVTGYQSVETNNNLFGSTDMVLLKYDPMGHRIDSIYQDGLDHKEDYGINLAVRDNAVYLYGWSEGQDGDYYQATIKYSNVLSCVGVCDGFINNNKIWTEGYFNSDVSWSYKYKFDSTVVVLQGKNYNQLLRAYSEFSEIWESTGTFIREENDRLYEYRGGVDYILYDFNLVEGDTFHLGNDITIYDLVVTDVDTVALLNGDLKRRWFLEPVNPADPDTVVWIEGIGNLAGLLANYKSWSFDEDDSEILCVYLNNSIVYDNPNVDSCWVMTTSTNEVIKEDLVVVPNPATNEIRILGLDNKITTVRIYNYLGDLVYKGVDDIIPVSDFSQGYYFIIIELNGYRTQIGGFCKI